MRILDCHTDLREIKISLAFKSSVFAFMTTDLEKVGTVSFTFLSHDPLQNVAIITGNEKVPLKQAVALFYDHLLSQAVVPADSSCHIT